ncbi:MAG: DUF853 family protein, partial [Salinibacterium sp.]
DLSLPIDVAGEAIAILAKRGAGKTNSAVVLVEELHAAGVQFVILDPVGAWWGIRSSGDGGSPGLPVPILGGQHGDVPLEPAAGAIAADVVVDHGASLLLDLSDFPSKSAHARFVVDFCERLFRRKARDRTLVHLVLEEADAFAPQTKAADVARMKGAVEQIVRRGRSRGLGTTMITQRSAVLDKDVLEQADVLIVMRTTGPNDRKAIERWVDVHADREEARAVLDSLPGLQTGEAWIWNPERALLERTLIRPRRTFDSSSTPKAGERRVDPKQIAPIDLDELGEQIKATAEKAKASDPAELRKTIRELERERAARPAETVVEERIVEKIVEIPIISDAQLDFLRQVGREAQETAARLGNVASEILNGISAASRPPEERRERREVRPAARQPPARPPARPASPRAERPRTTTALDELTRISGPQQRILDALAQLEAIGVPAPAKVQLSLFAKASPKSSAYTNNLGSLRTAGLIDYPASGLVALTEDGRAIADGAAAPSTVDELHEYVQRLVGAAKWRLLE